MAFIHVRSVSKPCERDQNWGRGLADFLIKSAALCSRHRHQLVSDPAEADAILFAERRDEGPYFEFVRTDPCYRRFRDKCFIFSLTDYPVSLVSGIYPSIPAHLHNPRQTRSGFFIADIEPERYAFGTRPCQYLASFIGSAFTHPIRRQLLELKAPNLLLQDTEGIFKIAERDGRSDTMEYYRELFVRVSLESKFILCPRGFGSSSIRLFEAMKMARVPVIISDEWVEPEGPDWSTFSLRVKEDHIQDLPAILRHAESKADEMGRLAKAAYDRWFSLESSFDTVGNWCLDLLHARRRYIPIQKWSFLLNRFHLRNYARTRLSLYRSYHRIFV
jgi:hypothetical protein